MDVVLKSLNATCAVSGAPFASGDKVVSVLVELPGSEFERLDVLEARLAELKPKGEVLCRWTHIFKPRATTVDVDREMRQSIEGLFLGLYESTDKPEAPKHDLLRFLALFLERKRLLRPKGPAADRAWVVYEHVRQKRTFLVPAGELDLPFFLRMQEQLAPLLGAAPAPARPVPERPPASDASPPASVS